MDPTLHPAPPSRLTASWAMLPIFVYDEEELEEETFVIYKEDIAVNVNTPEDLKIAEDLFKRFT